MITVQSVTSIQSLPRQLPDIYWHAEHFVLLSSLCITQHVVINSVWGSVNNNVDKSGNVKK
jgi:hypothetical protein